MEDFISEIYNVALVIDSLKEYLSMLDECRIKYARDFYNETASSLELLVERIAGEDKDSAIRIQSIALDVKNYYDDKCHARGIIEGRLLPSLYDYVTSYTGIDVTEGRYTLKSTSTGFLTIRDNSLDLYLHDTYDPMNEARCMVHSIYNSSMEGFHLLGCGLGYMAYQLYRQSNGAISITVYEEDGQIIDYAFKYGVLSLVPSYLLNIVNYGTAEKIAEEFINNINSSENNDFFISHWKESIYNGLCGNELNRINTNRQFELESAGLAEMNLWKNRKLSRVDFDKIAMTHSYDEWIVISAGPSLDDNFDFIRDNKGKKGLIAVNTVLGRLLKEGLIPDIVAAADQFNALEHHIKDVCEQTQGIDLIADWVLNWKYTALFRGRICFVRTTASEALTSSFIPNESVWKINGTVASLALEAAVRLKSKKIYLIGQDLAYPKGKMYAEGMVHNAKAEAKYELQTMSVDGTMVDTCEAFEWFRKTLENQIAKYRHVKFINLSKHGALIKGTYSGDDYV